MGAFDEITDRFRVVACSAVGVETGIKFYDYCRNKARHVSAIDITKDWDACVKKLKNKDGTVPHQMIIACADKLQDHIQKTKDFSNRQIANIAMFFYDCPAEVRMNLYKGWSEDNRFLARIHVLIKDTIVATRDPEHKGVTRPSVAELMKKHFPKDLSDGSDSFEDKLKATVNKGKRGNS